MSLRRRLPVLVVSLLSLASCAPAPGGPAPDLPVSDGGPAAATATWIDDMAAQLNARRAENGAGPLELCGTLVADAQAHTEDQAAHNTMSHTGSDGSNLADRANRAGYVGWSRLGENVAYGYGDVAAVMTGWMNSPGHRANILDARFGHVGVGLAYSSGGTPYWTQDFGASGSC